MATKIPEAHKRMYDNVFVCKNCKSKIRADPRKITESKISCRKCGGKKFRKVKKRAV